MKPSVQKIITKLAKEKVDLTAAGDASKLISITNQLMKKIDKDGDIYLKLYRNIQDNGDKLMEYFDLMQRTEKKLIDGAKDLGFPTPELAKELDKNMNKMLRMRKTYTF